jgi:hypothetical protein
MGRAGGSYSATTSHMGSALALLMHLNCCNFRPTGPFGINLCAECVIHGGCMSYSALPLAVTDDIRHQLACDKLLGLRQLLGGQLGLQLLSEGNSR